MNAFDNVKITMPYKAHQPMQSRNSRAATHRAAWIIAAILALSVLCGQAQAQVPVALAPSVHPQFVDASGKPLAGGFVFTYSAGTTSRLDTFTDSTGTIANSWPIPLDSTGAPSNGSTQTGIWLSNQSYKICGYNSSLVQQWCTDNVSAYQILQNIGNITFGSVTSDPSGAAGEIGYRSDLGCFRGYTTFWDCLVNFTGIQTLTNKTLTAPVITNAPSPSFISPSIAGLTLGGVSVASGNPTNFANYTNGAAGTTLNQLAKLVPSGAGSTAVSTAITDTGGVVGVVIAGAGTSGIGLVQQAGQAICVFDGSTTVEDYVQISSTTAGNCHDTGSAIYPTAGGQVIGRVLTTNAGAGNYLLDLFGHEIRASTSAIGVPVVKADQTGLTANVSFVTLTTPTANGFYRFSCFVVETGIAGTTSTLPSCLVNFTDADSSTALSIIASGTNTNNTVGSIGQVQTGANANAGFYAKSGAAISYSTSGYASNPSGVMTYAVHVRLEGPF